MKRTARGVYINLPNSPIEIKAPNGKIYKFSSWKKREMYINRMCNSLEYFRKLNDKFLKLTGIDMLTEFDSTMQYMLDCLYQKVYDDLQYK